jgi:hypothetical protein
MNGVNTIILKISVTKTNYYGKEAYIPYFNGGMYAFATTFMSIILGAFPYLNNLLTL